MPTRPQFSQELLVIGAVLLSFLAQLFAQQLWNQGDKSRDAIAEVQRLVAGLSGKIDATQRQVEEQSGILRQIVDGNVLRETRITKLEMGVQHAQTNIDETNALILRQFQRLEAQIADLQRAILQRQGR
jgi:peptidoglycan hydrolase CwlO-like protein